MITHAIKVHADPVPPKPTYKAGGSHHREHIRLSTVNQAKQRFMENVYVVLRSDPKEIGMVTAVYEEEGDVAWNGMQCKPVEVFWFDSTCSTLHHPSQLEYYKG